DSGGTRLKRVGKKVSRGRNLCLQKRVQISKGAVEGQAHRRVGVRRSGLVFGWIGYLSRGLALGILGFPNLPNAWNRASQQLVCCLRPHEECVGAGSVDTTHTLTAAI